MYCTGLKSIRDRGLLALYVLGRVRGVDVVLSSGSHDLDVACCRYADIGVEFPSKRTRCTCTRRTRDGVDRA
jgi:hypothetical protein